MNAKYRLLYENPSGRVEAEATTQEELGGLVSERVAAMVDVGLDLEGKDIDAAVGEVLRHYERDVINVRSRSGQTRIEALGLLRLAIRCYLSGLTYRDIQKALSEQSGETISHSSVGRFGLAMMRLGVPRNGLSLVGTTHEGAVGRVGGNGQPGGREGACDND